MTVGTEGGLNSKKKTKSKSNYEKLNLPAPKVDPRKIVLEMDLIDKQKALEISKGPREVTISTKEIDEPDLLEQVEIIRRQIVLKQLGKALPVNTDTGEVDIKKIMAIDVENSNNEPLSEALKKSLSPLKGEKASSSVIRSINPVFPVKPSIEKNSLTFSSEQAFGAELQRALSKNMI